MNSFPYNLKELVKESGVKIKDLSDYLGLANSSTVYKWLKNEIGILLPTAVKIANYFHCSLDYLFGRSDSYEKDINKECPPFEIHFKKVLYEQKISQYRLLKDNIVSRGNLDSWLNKKQTPNIESIIKIANYLKVSMDYLVGRE